MGWTWNRFSPFVVRHALEIFDLMFIPFLLLPVESSSVMALRTVKLMAGDGAAMDEAAL